MSFQKTVIKVASIILLVSLVVLGVLIWRGNKNVQYPPEIGNCPDYFTLQANGDCFNAQGLGKNTEECMSYNFSDMSTKERRIWAQKCGVTWDGIYNM